MTDEQGIERRVPQPQHESAAERETKKNPANQQDQTRPPQGRDVPPADTAERSKRDPDSPWMGGG